MSKKIVVIMLLTVTVFTAAAQSAASKPVKALPENSQIPQKIIKIE
jgi:hypothetical protein